MLWLRNTILALVLIAPVSLLSADAREQQVSNRSDGRGKTAATLSQSKPAEKLPSKLRLKDVPMVRQKGNFCVPASAAMIAGYHGIKTDQDQIAFLSSAASVGNQGTQPRDMLLAMEKLGFDGRARYWKSTAEFETEVLPVVRDALTNQGPVYISFAPGVFGDSGHGCVIVGYDDRESLLLFHNPWGNFFEKNYATVASEGRGILLIEAPQSAPIASQDFIQNIRRILPGFEGDILKAAQRLKQEEWPHRLVWCSRRDAREDQKFAVDTAREEGRKILTLSFRRNPAVLIPGSNRKGDTEKYYFVTRPPEGGAQFLVREITADGWSEPELVTLGSLTRAWPTRFESNDQQKYLWELPMIELHSVD